MNGAPSVLLRWPACSRLAYSTAARALGRRATTPGKRCPSVTERPYAPEPPSGINFFREARAGEESAVAGECGRSVTMLGRVNLELNDLRLRKSSAGELLTEL